MTPLVSVVVPTYNGERFVRETLESILAQRYQPVELIVCDDGSSDGTIAIVESFGARVRLVRQANQGVAAARNRAAGEARGELLAFLDHDDVWEPHLLDTLVPLLVAHKEWGLVYADSWVIDAHGERRGRRGEYLKYAQGRVFDELLHGNFIPVETTLMRTGLFRELGGCDTSLRYLEDFELCLRVARHGEIGFHPAPLARYRIHERNLSHELEPMLIEWLRLLEGLAREPAGLDAAERAIVEHETGRRCNDLAWRALRRRDVDGATGWLARGAGRGPFGQLARTRALHACLRRFPRTLGRLALLALPRRKLYGVATSHSGAPKDMG